MNTKFEYMYRDGANWKNNGSVVFAGGITPEIKARFEALLEPGDQFIADQLGIPEVFQWNPNANYDPLDPPVGLGPGQYVINEDDHCFHEFIGIEEVTNDVVPTDSRTFAQFVEDLAVAKKAGWKVFDPMDRCTDEVRERLMESDVN